jgi:hypothetical protein
VFRINGVVHHRIGSLLPIPGHRPEYTQLYIYDTEHEVSNRLAALSSDQDSTPNPALVASLIEMLSEHNPLVRQFRMARDRLMLPTAPDVFIRLRGSIDDHGSRFSLPAVPELAALLVADLTTTAHALDVVVETRAGHGKQIHPVNPSLMAMQYPLLFPYGDVGYHIGIKPRVLDPDNPPCKRKG